MPLDDSPADWMEGRDVQLQAAVDYILAEMKKTPGKPACATAGVAGLPQGDWRLAQLSAGIDRVKVVPAGSDSTVSVPP
jgi:hypothetical protein